MINFKHPNVLPVYEVFFGEHGNLCFTMPPSYGGDLDSEIVKRNRENSHFSEIELFNFISDIV
jgi:serine/threonine protein kinase